MVKTSVTHSPAACVSLFFLPHFDVFCDLLLKRPTATGNLFQLLSNDRVLLAKCPRHIQSVFNLIVEILLYNDVNTTRAVIGRCP